MSSVSLQVAVKKFMSPKDVASENSRLLKAIPVDEKRILAITQYLEQPNVYVEAFLWEYKDKSQNAIMKSLFSLEGSYGLVKLDAERKIVIFVEEFGAELVVVCYREIDKLAIYRSKIDISKSDFELACDIEVKLFRKTNRIIILYSVPGFKLKFLVYRYSAYGLELLYNNLHNLEKRIKTYYSKINDFDKLGVFLDHSYESFQHKDLFFYEYNSLSNELIEKRINVFNMEVQTFKLFVLRELFENYYFGIALRENDITMMLIDMRENTITYHRPFQDKSDQIFQSKCLVKLFGIHERLGKVYFLLYKTYRKHHNIHLFSYDIHLNKCSLLDNWTDIYLVCQPLRLIGNQNRFRKFYRYLVDSEQEDDDGEYPF